jgi:branched-chain amino acid transport system permease protein
VLGGRASVYGAIVAATILQLGPLRPGAFQSWNYLVFGGFLIAGGALLPNGLAGVVRLISRRLGVEWLWQHGAGSVKPAADEEPLAIPGKPLEVHGVSKAFGGVRALHDVTLTARPGAVTSVIGPNGSGKTTLLNLINGFSHPDKGTVILDGKQIQHLPPHKIAIQGVARTFQTPIVSPEVSVADTVAVGRIGRDRVWLLATILRLPSHWRATRRDRELASRALQRVGLSESALLPGSSLSLGHRRMLELARALAAEPSVILLDEIASGVDDQAVTELGRLIRELARSGATVLLVEHNFRLVLDVSDEIFVLANGNVIASGTPEYISSHPDVLEQYLGTPITAEETQ